MTDLDAPQVVTAITIALATKLPMRPVERVHAEAGAGLVGDRYHGSRHRHVSVQSASELAESAELLGAPVPHDRTRRNITISHGAVAKRPGARVRVGGAVLEVVRPAPPCRLMDDAVGPGAARAMHDRGGSILRVVESGDIAVGDTWHELAPDDPPGKLGR